MSTERFAYVARSPVLGVQLDRFEVVHVIFTT